MTRVGEVVAYPMKSLDGVSVDKATLGPMGALLGDRSYAFVHAGVDPETATVGSSGGYVNGKSEPAIHQVRARYELAGPTDATPTAVHLSRPARGEAPDDEQRFELDADRSAIETWIGDYLGYPVELVRNDDGGFPDDREATGPTIVSRATLETIASWYPEIRDAREARRRFRPNIILEDCPAFFEDRLFKDRTTRIAFEIGTTTLCGVNPCQRCIVPSRNPDTGAEIDGFRETFLRKRRDTMPDWSGGDWFDHDFRLMVNTVVPSDVWGSVLSVGDPLHIEGSVPADADPDWERTS